MCCCDSKKDCYHPEQKPNPHECTPEQIRECHGEVTNHPCASETKEPK